MRKLLAVLVVGAAVFCGGCFTEFSKGKVHVRVNDEVPAGVAMMEAVCDYAQEVNGEVLSKNHKVILDTAVKLADLEGISIAQALTKVVNAQGPFSVIPETFKQIMGGHFERRIRNANRSIEADYDDTENPRDLYIRHKDTEVYLLTNEQLQKKLKESMGGKVEDSQKPEDEEAEEVEEATDE